MKVPYYKVLLQEELARRCERNPRYSVRAFARALSINDGALSQILSGKRVPAFKTAQRIIRSLALSPEEEHEFIASLAEKHRSRGLQRMSPIFRDVRLQPKPLELSHDLFRVIADWYHSAIIELTWVEDFKSDPAWIAQELGISVIEAKLAIERLLNVGILKKDEAGNLKPAEDKQIVTSDREKSGPALRKRVKQMFEKAIFSLENDPFEQRYMYTFAFATDPERLPEAREMINEFSRSLSKVMISGRQRKVYQLCVALFPMQRPTIVAAQDDVEPEFETQPEVPSSADSSGERSPS
jgi:uncharacterized protein (TIGR02147 family)